MPGAYRRRILSRDMNRPSYAVVSSVVALLGMAGMGLKAAARWLPTAVSPAQTLDGGDFASFTAGQRVEWRPLSADAFALARRLDRPILLVVGAAWSFDARQADRELFGDDDVASFVNRNFVCVRVDADMEPAWLAALSPVTRVDMGYAAGFQVGYLDPQGHVYGVLGMRGSVGNDPRLFLTELSEASKAYYARMPDTEVPQEVETRELESGTEQVLPDHAVMVEQVVSQISPDGGFRGGSGRSLRARLWRYLMASGRHQEVRASLDPVLRTGVVDWIDGGFFRRASGPGWTHINFDKISVLNAEMMWLLAEGALAYDDPFYDRLAKNTFNSLKNDLVRHGYALTALVGDEDVRGRSKRRSFSISDVQPFWDSSLLSAEEARWAVKHLSLEPGRNPDMVIKIQSDEELRDPKTQSLLLKLREAKKQTGVWATSQARADVNAVVSAAMSRCARLWGEPFGVESREAFDRLSAFSDGPDVHHRRVVLLEDTPYLGDYLSYADAMLQRFLLTGEPAHFERGLLIIRRAMTLFDPGSTGLWRNTPGDGLLEGVHGANVPEVLDNFGESNVAKAIRLTLAYGRLLIDRPSEAAPLIRSGSAAAMRYGGLAGAMRQAGGGFLLATLNMADDRHAVVVGPDCVRLASALAARIATRFIAPAVGGVRQDLQKRTAGIYIVSGTDAVGPMSLEQAVSELPVEFAVR